jgi:hypothetical protein
MPSRTFFAIEEDCRQVLADVFDGGRCRVFEHYSPFDRALTEFQSPAEIEPLWPDVQLMLHAHDAGGLVFSRRIAMRLRHDPATFRFECAGWGLVRLAFAAPLDGKPEAGRVSHNTPARARAWADTRPDLGPPDDWDWAAVDRFARQLIGRIDARAVAKLGSARVLPEAAARLGL